ALIELALRIGDFAHGHGHDPDDRGNDADRAHDQWEEHPGRVTRHDVQRDPQDHGADVFRGGRFEQVRTATSAVADVVANQVGDDGCIARIVFRNTCFYFAHQVSADVGRLGVDTATQLG